MRFLPECHQPEADVLERHFVSKAYYTMHCFLHKYSDFWVFALITHYLLWLHPTRVIIEKNMQNVKNHQKIMEKPGKWALAWLVLPTKPIICFVAENQIKADARNNASY